MIKFKKYEEDDFAHCLGTGKHLEINLEKLQYECSSNCKYCDGLYKCEVIPVILNVHKT